LSNVQYFCIPCGRAVRLGARYLADGSKERYCRKCGTSAGQIAPPKVAHATGAKTKSAAPTKSPKASK
jgi:large subunit ribosomal protein L24